MEMDALLKEYRMPDNFNTGWYSYITDKPKPSIKIREFVEKKRSKIKSAAERKRNLLVEKFVIAPAPSRDYHGLHVYHDCIVWMRWRISHGPSLFPQEKTIALTEFAKDTTLQTEIEYVFGHTTFNFIMDLINQPCSLTSMQPIVLQKIISSLPVRDVLSLTLTCKRLLQELSTDEIWEPICRKNWRLSNMEVRTAGVVGWKKFFFDKKYPFKKTKAPQPKKIETNVSKSGRPLKPVVTSRTHATGDGSKTATIRNKVINIQNHMGELLTTKSACDLQNQKIKRATEHLRANAGSANFVRNSKSTVSVAPKQPHKPATPKQPHKTDTPKHSQSYALKAGVRNDLNKSVSKYTPRK